MSENNDNSQQSDDTTAQSGTDVNTDANLTPEETEAKQK